MSSLPCVDFIGNISLLKASRVNKEHSYFQKYLFLFLSSFALDLDL